MRFLYDLKHKARLSKTLCGIFHFWFRFVFVKFYIFIRQNAWTFWLKNVIISFKIKIIEKPHIVLLPDLWFLSCNNKFENPMISAWVGAPQKLTRKLTLRTETIFGDWKPFESDEKCFLFQLKSSFRSQDI